MDDEDERSHEHSLDSSSVVFIPTVVPSPVRGKNGGCVVNVVVASAETCQSDKQVLQVDTYLATGSLQHVPPQSHSRQEK